MAVTKKSIYQDALRLLADARLDTIVDDVESRFALDDAYADSVEFILRHAPWRFALKTAALVTTSGPLPGFANAFAKPTDWLRTHALFVLAGTIERPVDVREQGLRFSANVETVYIRYISRDFLNIELAGNPWPEHTARALAAYLAFQIAERVTGERSAPGRMSQVFAQHLGEAEQRDALPENPWLGYQLSGEFDNASRAVVSKGFWWWALKEVPYSSEADQLTTEPAAVAPYRFRLPTDWLRTHALFIAWDGTERPINIRESANDWSTDALSFTARYLSTDALDPATWPEVLAQAVLAYLNMAGAGEGGDAQSQATSASVKFQAYQKSLDEALSLYSRPVDPWLRFQLDGRYQSAMQMMMETGRWRWAVRTKSLTESSDPLPAEGSDGTVSDSYAYRFILPDDHIKTLWLYYLWGSGLGARREDLDYREEGGALHANRSPVTLRYVSRMGFDSTKWPAHVREAVLAYLEYSEAKTDPRMAGAAAAKLKLYEHAMMEAERFDDQQDMPPYRSTSRFVAARYSRAAGYRDRP